MRLLLACLALLLAPAAALVLTEAYASGIEEAFQSDAKSHVNHLNRVAEFYPPNVRKMRDAPAILQLKQMTSAGYPVAAVVCSSEATPYQRLFDHLSARCGQWTLLRRARRVAIVGVLVSVATFAVVLLSRIKVTRAVARQEWSGDWSHWFILRGMPLLILLQLVASSAGYFVLLQTITGKALYAFAILALPFAVLFWLQRRLVLAFVEPQALAAFRPKRSSTARRRSVGRFQSE